MASEAKILQPIARFASVYCKMDYELDPSNRHAIVLQITITMRYNKSLCSLGYKRIKITLL